MKLLSFSWWPLVSLRLVEGRLYARTLVGRRREIPLEQVRGARLYGGAPRFLAIDTAEGHYSISLRSRHFPAVFEYLGQTFLIVNEDEDLFSMWRVLVTMLVLTPLGALAGHLLLKTLESLLAGAALALLVGLAAGMVWHLAAAERRSATRIGLAVALALAVVAMNMLALVVHQEKLVRLRHIASESMPPAAVAQPSGEQNR